MKEDIKDLLEVICEMAPYAECDLVFIDKIAKKYGFVIDEDLKVQQSEKGSNKVVGYYKK